MVEILEYFRIFHRAINDLTREGRGSVLLTVAAGWFLSIGVRYAFPPLLPFFRTDFGIGLTGAGALLSGLWIAYALGQFPGGVLGDRIGDGKILVYSTTLSGISILLITASTSLGMLFAGTLAFGFATSLYGPTRYTIFTNIYSKRAGTAIGLTMAAGSIGNTVLPALAVVTASYLTWRLGFGVLVPVFFGVTVALWATVPNQTSAGGQTMDELSIQTAHRIASEITRGAIPVVVIIHIVLSFVAHGFLGFYPTYLIVVKGFSPNEAAILFSLYFAVGILVQLLVGAGKDKYGARWTLTIISGLYFAGLFMIHFAQTVHHFLFLTVLLSQRNGVGVVTNTFIAKKLDGDIKGSGLGLLRTLWILIGAMSPILVGYLGDIGQLEQAFLLLAGIAGIATVLTVLVPDH